jgi:ABC-2 type transport system permease protein
VSAVGGSEAAGAGRGAELKPITGPSAFGGSLKRFGSLLWLQSVTEFKAGYLHTSFGYLWSLVRPLLLFGVLLVVFTKIFRIGSEVPNYPAMLLLNIMLFTFFQEATTTAVTSVVDQENIVRKMQFPRIVIPLSIVLTAAFNLCLNMLAVFAFILIYGVEPEWTWLGLPLLVAALVVFTTCVSMLLSALYVRFRDVAIIWSVGVQILFYASPILYPMKIVGDGEVSDLIQMNPLTPLFELARRWIIDPTAPTVMDEAGSTLLFVIPIVLFVAVCALGYWVFTREAPRIAEEL